jgi:hypothetical protein
MKQMKMPDSTYRSTVNVHTSVTVLTKHSYNLRDRRIGAITQLEKIDHDKN